MITVWTRGRGDEPQAAGKFALAGAIALGLAGTAAPAMAQDAQSEGEVVYQAPDAQGAPRSGRVPIFDRDHVTIGIGGVYGPSYDGSDDYVASVIPVIQGKFKGVSINPRYGGVALDFIDDDPGEKITYAIGPAVGVSMNRRRQIKDPVVAAAGKLKTAVEVGVSGGISINRVLHDYDWVTFSSDVTWDVAGAHSGMSWTPAVRYSTPLSKAVLVSVNVSANYIDGDYADYYYSVSPQQAQDSGLPQFRADSGFESVTTGLLVGWDLSGDVRDGGFALIGLAAYKRMLGDAKDTPYTSLRGSPNQFTMGAGIAYTF